jgi:hypothetical protein
MPQTYCPTWTSTTSATTTNYYVPTWTSQYTYNTYSPTITVSNTGYLNNTTTTNSYADQIWQTWVYTPQNYTLNGYHPNLPEDEATRRARIEEQRRLGEERQRERRVACARARTLLDGFLSDEQKVELERKGRFFVTGSKGRRYCIRATGQSGNVDLLKPDGSLQAKLCAHPRGYLPDGDAWLAQMLEIRHDEDHFLRTANVHQGHLPADYRRELLRV